MIGDRVRKAFAGQGSSGSIVPGVDKLRLQLKGNSQAVARVRDVQRIVVRGSGSESSASMLKMPADRPYARYTAPDEVLPEYQRQFGYNAKEWGRGHISTSEAYTPPSQRSRYSAPLGPISSAPGTPHQEVLTQDQMLRKKREYRRSYSVLGDLGIGNNLKILMASRLYGDKVGTINLTIKERRHDETLTDVDGNTEWFYLREIKKGSYGSVDLYQKGNKFTAIVPSGDFKGIYPLAPMMIQNYDYTEGNMHIKDKMIYGFSDPSVGMMIEFYIRDQDYPEPSQGPTQDLQVTQVVVGDASKVWGAKSPTEQRELQAKNWMYIGYTGRDAKAQLEKDIARATEAQLEYNRVKAGQPRYGSSGYTYGQQWGNLMFWHRKMANTPRSDLPYVPPSQR